FSLYRPLPLITALFPYTTLFRSTNNISTNGIANAAPQAVYQSERWGTFSYALTNLMPGATHTLRLHFAEIFWDSAGQRRFNVAIDRKSTRLNSSHEWISYAVFCL